MGITSFAFIIAGLTAVWQYAKSIIDRLRSLLISRVTFDGEIAEAVYSYMVHNSRVLKIGDRYVKSSTEWVRPLDCMTAVAWEAPSSQPLFAILNGQQSVFRRVLMYQSPPNNYAGSMSSIPERQTILVVTSIRGAIDVVEFTRLALEFAVSRKKTGSRYKVRRIGSKKTFRIEGQSQSPSLVKSDSSDDRNFLHWTAEEVGACHNDDPFRIYALDESSREARQDFARWVTLGAWYKERGIPWRRGHLYYGPPGTGKTSLARALAQEANMPVFSFDLSTLSNAEFCMEWREMQESTPCMALLEDIDGCFNGRVNITGEHGGGLTFDCLLNSIGGIESCDGVFVVITTNNPESIDAAIAQPYGFENGTSRPGRIDRMFKMGLPTVEQSKEIIIRITGSCSETDTNHIKGMSAAQVTEYAISVSMKSMFS